MFLHKCYNTTKNKVHKIHHSNAVLSFTGSQATEGNKSMRALLIL